MLACRTLSPENYLMAFDPFGVYHHMLSNKIRIPKKFDYTQYVALAFISGVHIPESQELLRDLSVLCDTNQINHITDLLCG
jgi:hypothetical protein